MQELARYKHLHESSTWRMFWSIESVRIHLLVDPNMNDDASIISACWPFGSFFCTSTSVSCNCPIRSASYYCKDYHSSDTGLHLFAIMDKFKANANTFFSAGLGKVRFRKVEVFRVRRIPFRRKCSCTITAHSVSGFPRPIVGWKSSLVAGCNRRLG
jgi:hypothetical protein